jgi:hypothetical protein
MVPLTSIDIPLSITWMTLYLWLILGSCPVDVAHIVEAYRVDLEVLKSAKLENFWATESTHTCLHSMSSLSIYVVLSTQ